MEAPSVVLGMKMSTVSFSLLNSTMTMMVHPVIEPSSSLLLKLALSTELAEMVCLFEYFSNFISSNILSNCFFMV